jgi:hypothetical protein
MPLLTIFSTPKPFTNPHIAVIQRNAIRSWLALGADVQVILVGEEEGLAETARELSVQHIPEVARNSEGTPLLSSIFHEAREAARGCLLTYVNADIILFPDILAAAHDANQQEIDFLMVGRRWDLNVEQELTFEKNWAETLRQDAHTHGKLHDAKGSDYFVFPAHLYTNLPDFAIGRAGWDNWMIYYARTQGWPVIDATSSVTIIHQQHDYSHLPGGIIHHALPESDENMRLAGGRRHIFNLLDASHILEKSEVKPYPLTPRKILREIETYPLRILDNYGLGEMFFNIFHPIRWFRRRFPKIGKRLFPRPSTEKKP